MRHPWKCSSNEREDSGKTESFIQDKKAIQLLLEQTFCPVKEAPWL